jgi:hydrogenase expression/formation protein HypC
MCLAIPVRVDEIIDQDTAIADIGGVRKEINVSLVLDLEVGDYVILHVGYALNKLDKDEAEKTLKLFSELNDLERNTGSELSS